MAWRRRARSGVIWTLAGAVIALAVLVGLIQLALPWWASDPQRVARLLSSRLGSPVRIDAAVPTWSPRGPLIELRGVQFGADGDAGARIERAAWAIDFAGLVRPGRVFSEFRVHGLDLSLVRGDDGRWSVLGLPALLRGPDRPLASVLQALPAFALRDSRLTLGYAPDRAPVRLRLPELRRLPAGGSGARWRGWLFPGDDSGGPGLGLSLDMAADGSGRVHVAGAGLVLADWLGAVEPLGMKPASGALSLAAWIDLDRRGINDVQLELALAGSTWAAPPGPVAGQAQAPVPLPDLRFGARIRRETAGGDRAILVDQLVWGQGEPGRLHGRVGDGRVRLRGRALDLAPLATAAMLIDAVPAPLRRWLQQARPGGRVDSLALELADGQLLQASAGLSALQALPVPGDPGRPGNPGQPGISGLAVDLRGDPDGLVLWPAADRFVIDYPGVFAQPLPMQVRSGALAAWRRDDGWQLAADGLQLSGTGYGAQIDGGVLLRPGAPPLLDLGALVLDSQLEAAKAFWPLNRIPNTARWLNRALTAGRIVEAQAWLRGPADGFPFQDGSGRLEARVRVADAGLDYHPQWPALSAIQADLTFENARLAVVADSLRVGGLQVAGSRADVADLKQPVLLVAAQASAPGDQLQALLAATPLQVRYGAYMERMAIAGAPRVDLALSLPLKRELGESSVDGRVRFAGERFTDSGLDLDFGDLEGELRFTRNAIRVDDMALSLAGEPARLDLRIGAASSDPLAALQAELRGRLSASAVFGRVPALAPVLAAARGRADWRVRVQVPDADTGAAEPGWIRIDSDLDGIALDLPAPLAKEADVALPLRVDAATQVRSRPIQVRLGRLLAMRAQLADSERAFAGSVALGGASPEQLPARGLVISGQAPALDLSGWLALAGPGADADADTDTDTDWPRVILRAGELGVFGRGFREVDMQMRPGAEVVDVQLLGPDIEGSLQWPRAAAGRTVRGRFARLHVPEGRSSSVAGYIRPGAMPALDIEVADARIGGTVFGRTVLQARVVDDGYRIERFESRNSAFELDASGLWTVADGTDVSEMAIRLRADDLGAMLESFGFAGLIQGGRTEVGIDGRWAGSPAAFALERIDGRLDVEVGAGRIVDVDPGVGRLFGLLNLREIPRRLVLDFRDFFSQGMRFNSIQGSFQLNVGDAYTDNVLLKSPAADILITGRTGLIMRDYDQTLEVTPRLGGALPVVGAIAGGPAGAAAGLVVQGLLRIDQSNQVLYRVSGPWDRPEIVKQEPVAVPERRPRGDPGPGQAGP